MKKIIILDFETGEVHIYNYSDKEDSDEDFLRSIGHSPSNCQWMIVPDLKLQIH